MAFLVGTSGFQYDEWKGSFYPEKFKKADMLAYYAGKLQTVEINNTFYRMPRAATLASWGEQVPSTFQFVLKVSRKITHFKRLQEIDDELTYLVNTALELGSQLGPLLFQLPPRCPKNTERLATTLRLLPPAIRAAFEFRDERWMDEDVFSLLRDHNCALCVSDTDESPIDELPTTADWGYVRLRADNYNDQQLAAWSERLKQTGWTSSYTFFKHEDIGPSLALSLSERLGAT